MTGVFPEPPQALTPEARMRSLQERVARGQQYQRFLDSPDFREVMQDLLQSLQLEWLRANSDEVSRQIDRQRIGVRAFLDAINQVIADGSNSSTELEGLLKAKEAQALHRS